MQFTATSVSKKKTRAQGHPRSAVNTQYNIKKAVSQKTDMKNVKPATNSHNREAVSSINAVLPTSRKASLKMIFRFFYGDIKHAVNMQQVKAG